MERPCGAGHRAPVRVLMNTMQKNVIFSLIAALAIIVGGLYFAYSKSAAPEADRGGNVRVEDGVQVIQISAKGGYAPRLTEAKAGVPTIIRVRTSGTYDCSSALVIPNLGFRKILASTGVEEVSVPAEKARGTLTGLCSMGMYSFSIKFK